MKTIPINNGKPRPEIFLGLVTPVGLDLNYIFNLIENNMSLFGYSAKNIKFSDLIPKVPEVRIKISGKNEYLRIDTSMTAGNQAREYTRQKDILAKYAIVEIQKYRGSVPKEGEGYIFRSLKLPSEISTLREVYGRAFFLLGFSSSRDSKLKFLTQRKGMSQEEAEKLITRDENESNDFGQHTSDAFYNSDVFFDVDNQKLFEEQLKRFFGLIFGNPFTTPSKDEFAMFMAFSSSFRSADLSRQIGAVITSKEGDIIASGFNDVPKYGGGLYDCESELDYRDFQLGYDSNERRRLEIGLNVINELKKNSDQKALKKYKEILKRTGVFDITEYGRPVHAEMEALLSCVRVGVSPRAGTLYCTTFPCHNCAKHIIASGLYRVVFIEPYPKSKAMHLHNDAIILDTKNKNHRTKVVFQPFVGIGPRRFIDLFSLHLSTGSNVIRKEEGGDKVTWLEKKAIFRFPLVPNSYLDLEKFYGSLLARGRK